jgi:hypothetical protein
LVRTRSTSLSGEPLPRPGSRSLVLNSVAAPRRNLSRPQKSIRSVA